MDYYVIGDDKTLEEAYTKDQIDNFDASNFGALPTAGGTMTGDISYQGSLSGQKMIRFLNNTEDSYGNGISIGGGGITIIGGGEAATQVESLITDGTLPIGTERVVLASDNTIMFYVNAQNGIESATLVTMSTAGLLSGHQKAITYGTSAPSGGSNGDIYIQY